MRHSPLNAALCIQGVNVKLLYSVCILIISFSVNAKNICPVNEKIESDMRIPESHFTKENAEAALKKINAIVAGNDEVYEWVTVPNMQRIVEGYILKRDAENATGALAEFEISQFCTFMESSAWWYD